MSWNDRKNAEGYSDPTAYQALKNIETEEERFHKLLHMIFDICALSDFEIEGGSFLWISVPARFGGEWNGSIKIGEEMPSVSVRIHLRP